MTKQSVILLAVLSFIGARSLAQTLTPEEKAKYIGYLDSTDTALVLEALSEIEKYQITEAIPALENNIWKQWPDYQYFFLRTMWRLRSPNALAFAEAFIDTSDSFGLENKPLHKLKDPLQAKVDATEILIDLGDYSTVPFVFEILKKDSISAYSNAVYLLPLITLKVPAYAEKARTELIRVALHDSHDQIRWVAITNLVQLYGARVSDVLLQAAVSDPDSDNRIFALRKLIVLEYPQIKGLLYNRLYSESATYRDLIADTLLTRYGSIRDYQMVEEYHSWEQDSVNKRWIGYSLRTFKPPVPSFSISALVLLDTLASCKHQMLALNWLADANFVTELDANLESAHSYLSSGDSINCARQVRAFKEKVDAVYKDSLNPDPRKVTVEGWKFLYYNAQYILDRLPQIPPVQEHILSVPSQYATIQAAVNASRAGDVIEVSPGTYPERVSVNNRDSLILRTTGAIDQVTVRGFLLQQSSAITIKGFVVDATGTTEHGIVLMGGNNQNADVTIEACEIKNAGNDQSGIFVARGNPHTRIVNNRIHDNGRNGIVIIDATGGPHYVINNTIVRNGWNGVNVARQHVIYLVNNILSFNGTKSGSTGGRYGVLREAMTGPGEASGITLLNNLIVGNNGTITSTSSKDLGNHAQTLDGSDSGNYTTAGTEGTGVTIAPTLLFADIFVSSTDLHLKSGCFAINKGLSSYTPPDVKAGAIPAVDYEGEARPKGASVDVGADEKD